MDTTPPTYNQALDLIKKYEPFLKVQYYEKYMLVDYYINSWSMFRDDPLTENFRGIIYDTETGEIVSLPFKKFYNINENPSVDEMDLIKTNMSGVITEKEDGSLVQITRHKGRTIVSSRSSMSLEAGYVRPAVENLISRKYTKLEWLLNIHPNYTFMFEYLNPEIPIVIVHPEEKLIYLGARNKTTGETLNTLGSWYLKYYCNIDTVKTYSLNLENWLKYKQELLTDKTGEGYVVRLNNGTWFKAKKLWYINAHKIATEFNFKNVIFSWVSGTIDDDLSVLSYIDPNGGRALQAKNWIIKVEKFIEEALLEYINIIEEAPKTTAKDLAIYLTPKKSKNIIFDKLFGFTMNMYRTDNNFYIEKNRLFKEYWMFIFESLKNSASFLKEFVKEIN